MGSSSYEKIKAAEENREISSVWSDLLAFSTNTVGSLVQYA